MMHSDPISVAEARVVHLTGIKGTGVAALAEVLVSGGASVSGSDGPDTFYTDELLKKIGVTPRVGFSPDHVPPDAEVLVYSAAYGPENPERQEARRRGISQFSYAEALGALSQGRLSLGVGGVHGKTSTTAMLGAMVARTDLPATVVVGSAVPSFGGSATLLQGRDLLIAETCEYRRHFLSFAPDVAIVTSVEADHQDYFPLLEDMIEAFVEYTLRISSGGTLVYCADDAGACEVARRASIQRGDLTLLPYGFSAEGAWRCTVQNQGQGVQRFILGDGEPEKSSPGGQLDDAHDARNQESDLLRLFRNQPWELPLPGVHMVANATGAICALRELLRLRQVSSGDLARMIPSWRAGLADFRGTRRRSEVVARLGGVTIIDDYAHHPTAIEATLEGLRAFYPLSRLVVVFMSHTYSRTAALLDRFARAFSGAHQVILNDIYASAREENETGITGERLFQEVSRCHPQVIYEPDFEKVARYLLKTLCPGDVLVTMGAGDNFRIGRRVEELLRERGDSETERP
ncbi:UDP-N-acetylmuramate--L-alanine ligase [Alkalispirochaeta americana]|uniref:UDP-N-acetylmuramate--L-alanine ligase n=1 Tax=Alkalispirochaeta americana TaxID=159291 RepID=A0A1N6UYL7_9SPIO|nr:UDP-N-acetylmuramate--L-alanine ligase [Alkalispirochaeta americana]SIQ70705.1 UDP-N-acetylmuramate--L-alanine ligase [Alkalispirochaeta americana]